MQVTSNSEEWVRHWQRVGPILQEKRRDELRNLTDADAARAFCSLADFMSSQPLRTARKSSGFIEQQRLFSKLREA